MRDHAKPSVQTQIVQPKILYFGTPVVLLTTYNEDKSSNISPISSAWALGNRVVLGLGEGGHGLKNLQRHGECVINVPNPELWEAVESLAPFTGANLVPPHKEGVFHYRKDKFAASGLTAIPSIRVRPDRIAECPLQIEATVESIRMTGEETPFAIIETKIIIVHAHKNIAIDDSHIDPIAWSPIIYNFRHYFGLGPELGKTFRAEV